MTVEYNSKQKRVHSKFLLSLNKATALKAQHCRVKEY